jgi:hypothetical protein
MKRGLARKRVRPRRRTALGLESLEGRDLMANIPPITVGGPPVGWKPPWPKTTQVAAPLITAMPPTVLTPSGSMPTTILPPPPPPHTA